MAVGSDQVEVWRDRYVCIKCGSKQITISEPHYNNDIDVRKVRCKNRRKCGGYSVLCYDTQMDREVNVND